MNEEKLSLQTQIESSLTNSVRVQLLQSFRDPEYRRIFSEERLRSSVALQIRALRHQRDMTQAKLGDAIGMAQTWVSKLEDPEYGKMTVATLLRLAGAFDTDLEIKFRPFSKTLDSLPNQGPEYFYVASFEDEFGETRCAANAIQIERRIPTNDTRQMASLRTVEALRDEDRRTVTPRKTASMAANAQQENGYGYSENTIGQSGLALRHTGIESSRSLYLS